MTPRDTDPPPPSEPTEIAVPAGKARAVALAALANLAHASGEVAALLEAYARALDASATAKSPLGP